MPWYLTGVGLVILLAMFILIPAGLHMMVQPDVYVGRGPIPANNARNVRMMGGLFAALGGIFFMFFSLPILLASI